VTKQVYILAVLILSLTSCVYDNEQELFPHIIIPDSSIQGPVAWFNLDSGLMDRLGQVDPLRFWGSMELGRDHHMTDSAALIMDGVEDYLSGYLGRHDSLAVSLWFLPLPNYRKAFLFDYGIGQFAAGLDAVTSATMPRFNLFLQHDTATYVWAEQIDYFFWHHLYIEIGDTLLPPRIYVDGYPPEPADTTWRMHPLTDLFYLGRPFNADIMDTLLYRGYLDEIRIFSNFLTDEEIVSLYWDGKPHH